MRLAALLVVLLASSSAPAAQHHFVEACVASSDGEDLGGSDVRSICGCAAERAVSQGISAASLDGLTQYVGDDGKLDLGSAPAPVQAMAEIVVEGLFTCLFSTLDPATALASSSAANPPVPGAVPTSAVARAQSARAGERRTTQAGRGATIRIRG